jgi:hypothetical protein
MLPNHRADVERSRYWLDSALSSKTVLEQMIRAFDIYYVQIDAAQYLSQLATTRTSSEYLSRNVGFISLAEPKAGYHGANYSFISALNNINHHWF